MVIQQYIEVDTTFQALHHWPECDIKEVLYLKDLHRHLIYVTVKAETSEDRGIEFFVFKEFIDKSIDELYGTDRTKNLGRKSMEEIGTDLLNKLREKFGDRYYQIKVSEDNQVRGIIEYA